MVLTNEEALSRMELDCVFLNVSFRISKQFLKDVFLNESKICAFILKIFKVVINADALRESIVLSR